ncbi:MAG: DUF2892 domain-containing protein [Hyphomicrobium sp.]
MEHANLTTDCNAGKPDRTIRVIAGLALLGLPLAWYGLDYITNFGFLGLIPLVTGLTGVCPVYRLLGISTCKR